MADELVAKDRFDDLKDMLDQRFTALEKSLDALESKEHHSSEIELLRWRLETQERSFRKFRENLWLIVSTVAAVVAFLAQFVFNYFLHFL